MQAQIIVQVAPKATEENIQSGRSAKDFAMLKKIHGRFERLRYFKWFLIINITTFSIS